MTKPAIRIFLIRHGLSEANIDKTVHFHTPDHAVELSEEGHEQARRAGSILADYLALPPVSEAEQYAALDLEHMPQRRARMLVSPYTRTRQTADRVAESLKAAGIRFDRRECEELREISFGLFDGLSIEEIRREFPREQAYYEKHKKVAGELFAPMPLGESRIQVGDRVKQSFGTILRDAEGSGDRAPIHDFFVVAHGISINMFLQRWMHMPWEQIEARRNPDNCSITLIEGRAGQHHGPDGKSYVETSVFAGFPHEHKTRQDIREEGNVA